MGLFNKLKNVIFEEEVVEVPVEEPKKEEKKVEEVKVPVKEESFKAEKSFDFLEFDDKEFDDFKVASKEEKNESMSINLFDYEKPKKPSPKPTTKSLEIKGRAYEPKKEDVNKHKFKPSPVISPVYGVLDKNYKKEDLIVEKEEKKPINVDDVRKRAYGTLVEDVKRKTEMTQEIVLPKEEDKTIDELLEETAFDTIDIPDLKEEPEVIKPKEKEPEEVLENDTIENDLFDLIDSMYENKEEE